MVLITNLKIVIVNQKIKILQYFARGVSKNSKHFGLEKCGQFIYIRSKIPFSGYLEVIELYMLRE